MSTKLFDNVNLTDGEKEFVHNVLLDKYIDLDKVYCQKADVLATLLLAKRTEEATKQNAKTSKVMIWLTIGLVFAGLVQVAIAILNATGII